METTIKRSYFLVKRNDLNYMGKQHDDLKSALEHITYLKNSIDPDFKDSKYDVVYILETETRITIE